MPDLQNSTFDPDWRVFIETSPMYGKIAFQKQKKVKIWKLTFNENDFDDFLKYLRKTKNQPEE